MADAPTPKQSTDEQDDWLLSVLGIDVRPWFASTEPAAVPAASPEAKALADRAHALAASLGIDAKTFAGREADAITAMERLRRFGLMNRIEQDNLLTVISDDMGFSRSHPRFVAQCQQCLGQWRFNPASVKGIIDPAAGRVMTAVDKAVKMLSPDMGAKLASLVSAENIATMMGFVGLLVALQWTPLGWAVDAIVLTVTVVLVGAEVSDILGHMEEFVRLTSAPDGDLDAAAHHLSTAISAASVDLILAMVLHKPAGKAMPVSKPPAGFVDVIMSDGRIARVSQAELDASKAGKDKAAKTPEQAAARKAVIAKTKADLGLRDDLGDEWFKDDGELKWPDDNGAVGGWIDAPLEPPAIVDRFGPPRGKFLSPAGTSFEARALPYEQAKSGYHRYQVLKPFKVQSSKAAPAFDQAGGATQFCTEMSVQKLIDLEFLKEI